jgi:hypothetical protein
VTNEELENLDLDEVFGNPDLHQPNPNAPVVAQQPTQEVAQPAQSAEPFLRTASGTVYKSAEDAAKGVEHKDQLIAKLRQDAIERTGVDPLTGQPVQKTPTPPRSYTQDSKRFIEDLANAAKTNDSDAYARVQAQFIQDVMAPYAPVLVTLAKNQAVESVSKSIPEFRQFIDSTDYSETLNRHPILRDAIQQTELNPSAGDQVAQLYRMTFELASKKPEVVRAQAQPIPRPTVSSTSLPSVPQGSQAAPDMGSIEGRKAIIEQQERAGVMNLRF